MGLNDKPRYVPPTEFEEVKKDPLIDINSSDSTELWLIQYPKNQASLLDLNGQEVSLKLHREGNLGSFSGSSGKSYDMVKATDLDPAAAVFLCSASGSKIAGKISRRVSLVHYPDPSELQEDDSLKMKLKAQRAAESLSNISHRSATASQINGSRSSKVTSSHKSPSSRTRSSGPGQSSQPPKKRHVEVSKREQSADDSVKERSGVTEEEMFLESSRRNRRQKIKLP